MRKTPSARVSLSTIAQEAGVSISTVSRIANGHLHRANANTVRRVQDLLAATGYRPDNIGRSLRRGESRIVAMLAPNLDNPAMAAIASSTEAALRKAGFVMLLCDTHDEPALQDEYLEVMRSQQVQGYVVVSSVRSPTLIRFLDRGDPIVLVGRRRPESPRIAPFVGIDNRAAGATAADFIVETGARELAIVHTALSSSAISDRVAGFLQRIGDRGGARERVRLGRSDRLQHLDAGYEAAGRLIAAGGWPEGIFCVSDLMAYGVYRLATETGCRVPDSCRIVGVDDNQFNAWIAPWLTSVHIPYKEFGDAVVSQLKSAWSGGDAGDLLLPHRLVARSGTAAGEARRLAAV